MVTSSFKDRTSSLSSNLKAYGTLLQTIGKNKEVPCCLTNGELKIIDTVSALLYEASEETEDLNSFHEYELSKLGD
ncbi:hypothetical protein JK628_03080 [Shewanella sp. KX20019]|uniref:hypothetical protein n=1 Tax=Shewanella sp. KX20019 TaxID=2803864 RepID=UPI00192825B5|nr:hypothetical protein [Shewanella sp. KX20019]QQX80874.1 hypothetical protein JK628_03080 [Shewanella sp. KX20019]